METTTKEERPFVEVKQVDHCPRCGTDLQEVELSVSQLEQEDLTVWQEVTCKGCGCRWREYFDFAGYRLTD